MNSPPDATTLAGLQARFGAALRAQGDEAGPAIGALAEGIVDDGLDPAARVQVYRNNARAMFEGALERTYPVLRRRTGDGYFRSLAREYRAAHPSRSGDLHWVGRAFPAWLAGRLADGEYQWLADLARLEWACEETLVAERRPPLDAAVLARVPPEGLADVVLDLQPCLRVVQSAYPVWSVWRENQPGAPGEPVDFSLGPQQVVVTCGDEGPVLHSVPVEHFEFVAALASGRSLGEALDSSALEVEQLPGVLAWLFGEGLVVALRDHQDQVNTRSP